MTAIYRKSSVLPFLLHLDTFQLCGSYLEGLGFSPSFGVSGASSPLHQLIDFGRQLMPYLPVIHTIDDCESLGLTFGRDGVATVVFTSRGAQGDLLGDGGKNLEEVGNDGGRNWKLHGALEDGEDL